MRLGAAENPERGARAYEERILVNQALNQAPFKAAAQLGPWTAVQALNQKTSGHNDKSYIWLMQRSTDPFLA